MVIMFALMTVEPPSAQAQTFKVIHYFAGVPDGWSPLGRLSIDGGGHLYGATYAGGIEYAWFGVVFKMSPEGSGWIFSPIYSFTPQSDGGDPAAGVLFGPDGSPLRQNQQRRHFIHLAARGDHSCSISYSLDESTSFTTLRCIKMHPSVMWCSTRLAISMA
jgi:hypothetical protein